MRVGLCVCQVALLACAVAFPAVAQSQSSSAYPECTITPSKEDSEAAHNGYLFGKRKFDEAEYSTAVNYFKDAYKTDCTKHELLIIISRAYELSGNKPEAISALETYLKRAPNAADADTQRKRIANLKAQMAASQPAAPPTAPTATATTTATSAPTTTTGPDPAPPATANPDTGVAQKQSFVPWIVVGVGGLAVLTGVVLVLSGASSVSSANDFFKSNHCDLNSHTCPTSGPNAVNTSQLNQTNDKLQSGYRSETIGGVVIGVGAAAIAGGLVWHFVLDKPKAQAAGLEVRPEARPGYAGVGVALSF
jgi:hypothetical protein